MDGLTSFEAAIGSRFGNAASEAVQVMNETDRFTDSVAQAIAGQVVNVESSIADKAATFAIELTSDSGVNRSLIGMLANHLFGAATEQPKYIPVASIAPAVVSALKQYSKDSIAVSSWSVESIPVREW